LPFLTAFTIPLQAPVYIVASIEANYFGFIAAKYIIIRHPEVSKTTIYLLLKNLKEHRAAYPILHTEPQPFSRPQLITPAIEDDVMELLIRAPTHYFNKIRHWILMNHNIWISESTVCYIIKRKEFT
jgi:hypothetical protein